MLNILIADDDIVGRRLLDSTLKKWGHIVISCADGDSAWNELSSGKQIDVAILDWIMPGLQGPEICERHTRIDGGKFCYRIILSGQMEREQIFQALHRGAHDVLEKPCDLTLLRSRLEVARKIVDEKRTMEEMSSAMERYALHMENLAAERAQQLVHADRMSSLGTMASGIAHEINNPMSFISGNVQNLQRFWSDIEPILLQAAAQSHSEKGKVEFILEEMPQILEGMMKGVHRVTKIVNGLRKYSGKNSSIEAQPFNINECIQQAVDLCKGSIGSQAPINLELAGTIPPLQGDALQIEQVLVNLIVNASHAIENSCRKEISILSRAEGDQVTVLVEDTGSGIAEDIIGKIFDPFMTTKALGKGTGLGLSISSGIVKAHGGTIEARNRSDGGACFEMRFPVGGKE